MLALLSAQLGRHIFEPSPDPLNCSIPSTYDNVSVAAENVAGVGAAGTCTAQPICELPREVRTRLCAPYNSNALVAPSVVYSLFGIVCEAICSKLACPSSFRTCTQMSPCSLIIIRPHKINH